MLPIRYIPIPKNHQIWPNELHMSGKVKKSGQFCKRLEQEKDILIRHRCRFPIYSIILSVNQWRTKNSGQLMAMHSFSWVFYSNILVRQVLTDQNFLSGNGNAQLQLLHLPCKGLAWRCQLIAKNWICSGRTSLRNFTYFLSGNGNAQRRLLMAMLIFIRRNKSRC